MSCSLSAPRIYYTDWKCPANKSEVSACKPGYRDAGIEKVDPRPSGGFCFGDFFETTYGYHRKCIEEPAYIKNMSLEQKVRCCTGQTSLYSECPVNSSGKPVLCPQSSNCDSIIREWCSKTHGGDSSKVSQLESEIKKIKDDILLNPYKESIGPDPRLTQIETKKGEIVKYAGKGGPDDPNCGCALPASYYATSNMFGPIECIDKRCTNPQAYKLSTQIGTTCAITNCVAGNLNLSASELANIDNVKIEQDCGTSYLNQLRKESTSTSTNYTSLPINGTGVGDVIKKVLVYGLILVVIGVAVFLVVRYLRYKKVVKNFGNFIPSAPPLYARKKMKNKRTKKLKSN